MRISSLPPVGARLTYTAAMLAEAGSRALGALRNKIYNEHPRVAKMRYACIKNF